MEIPHIDLDLIQTLATAGVVFLTGMLLKKKISILEKLNIPSAVLGGLVYAAPPPTYKTSFFSSGNTFPILLIRYSPYVPANSCTLLLSQRWFFVS